MEMARILSCSVKSIERDQAMKQEVDSALRLVPNDGYLVMIAALLQTDMDWLEEAEATFQRAIEINPREPKVFYNYFTLLAKKRDVSKARWASDRSPATRAGIRLLSALARDCGIRMDRRGGASKEISG